MNVLEMYLDVMFTDHKSDIDLLESFKDKDIGIVFRNVKNNQENIKIDGIKKKILAIGNSSFNNILHRNYKMVVYES